LDLILFSHNPKPFFFFSLGGATRTVDQCRTKLKNLKASGKKKNDDMVVTGGGPPQNLTQFETHILELDAGSAALLGIVGGTESGAQQVLAISPASENSASSEHSPAFGTCQSQLGEESMHERDPPVSPSPDHQRPSTSYSEPPPTVTRKRKETLLDRELHVLALKQTKLEEEANVRSMHLELLQMQKEYLVANQRREEALFNLKKQKLLLQINKLS
jgi:hypothetical protein